MRGISFERKKESKESKRFSGLLLKRTFLSSNYPN